MTDRTEENPRIGELLLRDKLITQGELETVLAYQARQPKYRPIGQILTQCGFVSKQQLRGVLTKHVKQVLLGVLLVRMGFITEYQLEEALRAQQGTRKKLGRILMDMKLITRSQLIDALYLQLDVTGTDLDAGLPEKELLNKVSASFLRSKRVVPLRYDGKRRILTVLMEEVSERETVEDLERALGITIEPLALHDAPIESLIDRLFDVWGAPA